MLVNHTLKIEAALTVLQKKYFLMKHFLSYQIAPNVGPEEAYVYGRQFHIVLETSKAKICRKKMDRECGKGLTDVKCG